MFNVGDVVTVRSDLVTDQSYGADSFVEDMRCMLGKSVTIKEIYENKYKIKECDYNWTNEMFVEYVDETEVKKMGNVVAQFPEVSVPERDDTEYLERCVALEEELYQQYSCDSHTFIPYAYNHNNVIKANKFSNDQKKTLNDIFSRHPLWDNETHSIVFEADLFRAIDRNVISNFLTWVKNRIFDKTEEAKIGMFTYDDVEKAEGYCSRIIEAFSVLNASERSMTKICGHSYRDIRMEKEKWDKIKSIFCTCDVDNIETQVYPFDRKFVFGTEKDKYYAAINLLDIFLQDENCVQFVTEDFAKACTEFEERTGFKINGVVGKKSSKVINAVCKAFNLDKIKVMKETVTGRQYDDGYNRRYAEFADAINPLQFKQKTIITTDRIAFLTASFGTSWASCYTIDKTNERGSSNNYEGCYSGGTTSYGSDTTTFVLYTISNDYTGENPVLAGKINRCFFSLGEGKLIQSRNYPDGRDGGDTSLAAQFRAIVQKVVADCLDIPNLWVNKKGRDECDSVICYEGAGYHDHTEYDDCNVSYWKGMDGNAILNTKEIVLGSRTICPNCGERTSHNDCVLCPDCQSEGTVYCADCGCEIDLDYAHEINGEYYCEDCCFYCEYHQEWETGTSTYIEDYGDVCEDAIEWSSDFYRCDYCDEWHYDRDDRIEIDGNYYCSENCAENAGYVLCADDEWRRKDEAYYCEECGEYYTEDEFDFEHNMCKDCVEINTENEEETVA